MEAKMDDPIYKMVPTHILKIKPYVPGKPIEEVKRELGVKKVIKLASNENALGPSPRAIQAIKNYASKIHLYPDGAAYYLREDIASYLGVDSDNIIVGNGSDEIVSIITRIFIQKGDQAIMGDPSFLMYRIDTQLSRGEIVTVPLKDFSLDVSRILNSLTDKTRLIFISNPNNPTGTILKSKEMQELIQNLPPGTIVISDEAYHEYVDDSEYPDTLTWVKEGKNIIVLRTFSKIYGLAGLRVGYAIAKKQIISILNKVRPPFNVNSLAQVAARAALKDRDHVIKSKNLIRREKEFLYSCLKELKVPFVPTQANFILIETGENTKEIILALLKKGIIVRGMEAYNLPNHIRLTVGTREENETFIRELQNILQR